MEEFTPFSRRERSPKRLGRGTAYTRKCHMELRFDGLISDDGGFADIWRAYDATDRLVAVKIIRESSIGIFDALAHAKALVRSAHKNIVTVLAVTDVEDPGRPGTNVPAIVMEYLPGETLHAAMLRGSFSSMEVLQISVGLISAVRHVHQAGMVHGDLHEKNVMIVSGEAKLIDLLYRYSLLAVDVGKRESLMRGEIDAVRLLIGKLAAKSSIASSQVASFLKDSQTAESLDALEVSVWALCGAPMNAVSVTPAVPQSPAGATPAVAPAPHAPLPPAEGKARFRSPSQPLGKLFNRLPAPGAQQFPDVFLASGPAAWLRILPAQTVPDPLGGLSIDHALHQTSFMSFPLNQSGDEDVRKIRAADGIGLCTLSGTWATSVSFCFKNGEFWTIDTSLHTFNSHRVFLKEDAFAEAMMRGVRVLRTLGVSGPYRWEAGLEGIAGCEFAPIGRSWTGVYTFAADEVVREGALVDARSIHEARELLSRFFVAVYEEAHMPR